MLCASCRRPVDEIYQDRPEERAGQAVNARGPDEGCRSSGARPSIPTPQSREQDEAQSGSALEPAALLTPNFRTAECGSIVLNPIITLRVMDEARYPQSAKSCQRTPYRTSCISHISVSPRSDDGYLAQCLPAIRHISKSVILMAKLAYNVQYKLIFVNASRSGWPGSWINLPLITAQIRADTRYFQLGTR